MLSKKLGKRCDRYMDNLVRGIKDRFPWVSPNAITLLGVFPNIVSALLYAFGHVVLAGVFLLVGGFFDMLDGAYARVLGETTSFGGILDSTIDRYNDFFPWMGIVVYYSLVGEVLWVVVALFAVLGSFIIPYVKARAENLVGSINPGIMERPERILALFVFSVLSKLELGMVVIAVLTHITAIQRIMDARKKSKSSQ